MFLVPVEGGDGIVQTPFRILLRMGRKGIVHARRPSFLFEGCQDQLLVRRRHFELFDDKISEAELLAFLIPLGNLGRAGWRGQWMLQFVRLRGRSMPLAYELGA